MSTWSIILMVIMLFSAPKAPACKESAGGCSREYISYGIYWFWLAAIAMCIVAGVLDQNGPPW